MIWRDRFKKVYAVILNEGIGIDKKHSLVLVLREHLLRPKLIRKRVPLPFVSLDNNQVRFDTFRVSRHCRARD
jgi:hypothetical protein